MTDYAALFSISASNPALQHVWNWNVAITTRLHISRNLEIFWAPWTWICDLPTIGLWRRARLDFLLDAPLEPGPSLLAAEALEAAVHAVFHHRNELLVTEQAVAVVVKDLKYQNTSIRLAFWINAGSAADLNTTFENTTKYWFTSTDHLEYCVDQVRAELPPGADGDRPRELVFRDGFVGQCVHAHGNLRRIERVERKALKDYPSQI